jgi:hypothetical protein
MKTVKKTSVKKYQSGGSARKSTIAGITIPVVGSAAAAIGTGIKNKKAKKLVKKTQELESEYSTPTKVRNESTFKELENLGKKRGGSVAKMKSGGMVKKYQPGGPTKKNPKSYSEADFSNGSQMETTVQGPNNYKKQIRWEGAGTGNSSKKPYTMTVTKGGKTNTFKLSEEQAKNQRTIAKKEAGQKKKMGGSVAKMKVGGTAKPKAMYGKTVKPTMMKKGGTTKKK